MNENAMTDLDSVREKIDEMIQDFEKPGFIVDEYLERVVDDFTIILNEIESKDDLDPVLEEIARTDLFLLKELNFGQNKTWLDFLKKSKDKVLRVVGYREPATEIVDTQLIRPLISPPPQLLKEEDEQSVEKLRNELKKRRKKKKELASQLGIAGTIKKPPRA